MNTIPEWLTPGTRIQLNPDAVMEEWTLAWMGSIGVVERIDQTLQCPVVVSFEGDMAWHHFKVDEVMPAVEKIPAPNLPEYVKITRAEYDRLKRIESLLPYLSADDAESGMILHNLLKENQ